MRPMAFTTTALAATDDDSICLSQTPSGAVNLTIAGALASGGVATLTSSSARPRYGLQLVITCAGSDAGKTFAVTGTMPGGAAQTETIAGSNGSTTNSVLYWETVTQVTASAATAGAVKVGTNQAGATAWLPMDIYTPSPATTESYVVAGTINYSVVYTNEDPFDTSITQLAKAHPDAALTTATASQTATALVTMRAIRILINSGSGTLRASIVAQSTA